MTQKRMAIVLGGGHRSMTTVSGTLYWLMSWTEEKKNQGRFEAGGLGTAVTSSLTELL